MAKKASKKINSMWGGRFSSNTNSIMEKINSSIEFDYRLADQDIEGSIAHVRMLCQEKIISEIICKNILNGLKTVKDEIKNGDFNYNINVWL